MLLANVNLYIGNDSGPTHIAASVGTDTLTIFGPTDIRNTHQNLKSIKAIISTSNQQILRVTHVIKGNVQHTMSVCVLSVFKMF